MKQEVNEVRQKITVDDQLVLDIFIAGDLNKDKVLDQGEFGALLYMDFQA
jgi:hypothetical protein